MSKVAHRIEIGETETDTLCSQGSFPSPETLELVTDETRRAIVATLWTADDPPLRFSVLRRRSGIDESGRFNYHLKQLLGQCVNETDGGYELTPQGRRFVEALHSVPTLDGSSNAGVRPGE